MIPSHHKLKKKYLVKMHIHEYEIVHSMIPLTLMKYTSVSEYFSCQINVVVLYSATFNPRISTRMINERAGHLGFTVHF